MPEYMPVVAPHAMCGPMKAVGQVTGTQYLIVPSGTWVWYEDLPGLLKETRSCCPRTDEPVRAFFLVAGSVGNVVPWKAWGPVTSSQFPVFSEELPEAPVATENVVAEVQTAGDILAEGKEDGAPRLSPVGLRQGEVREVQTPVEGVGMEQAPGEAGAEVEPSQGPRKRGRRRPVEQRAQEDPVL